MRDFSGMVTLSTGLSHVVCVFAALMIWVELTNATLSPSSCLHDEAKISSRDNTNYSSLLECLQVGPPILSSAGGCQQTLMSHVFASSYGQPFVGEYKVTPCDFNRVTMNLTVTSAGRQFDRLALMYLGDIEVFRTSTAEPTQTGITWTYIKDMTAYISLFKTPQKVIFDLGNIIDDTYTGPWNTTLTVTFFRVEDDLKAADVIIPISARGSAKNSTSAFIVPSTRAISTFSLPKNAKKAVVSISACGQATEEFWWSNVLTSDSNAFGNETTLYGHSAFREIELLIDGNTAGVAWPFPVIFTGGVVPGLWRPIVGIDAFDLREDEIVITPFIPMLSDDKEHSFEIRVTGIDNNEQGEPIQTDMIASNWVVTGKVFLWLDENVVVTTGTLPKLSALQPSITLQSSRQQGANGTVGLLDYSIEVSRKLRIESTIITSAGPEVVYWSQDLAYLNIGTLSNQGNDQVVRQKTEGRDADSSGYIRTFRYPLQVNSSYNAPVGGNLTINAEMSRAKITQQLGELAFPNEWKTFDYNRLPLGYHMGPNFLGSNLDNWQNGTASYLSVPAEKKSYGAGTTEQKFTLSGISIAPLARIQGGTNADGTVGSDSEELYYRHIKATNNSIVYDEEFLKGQAQARCGSPLHAQINDENIHEFAQGSLRSRLGRGPPN